MLAQSAIHEPGGARAAADLPKGGKAKKKPQFLAGLFSDILSQAQRGLGVKQPEGAKAQSPHRAEALDPKAAAAARKVEGTRLAQGRAQLPAASKVRKESAETHGADETRARRKTDKKNTEPAEELAGVDAQALKGADERRRIRTAKDGAADEIAALRARGTPAKASSGEALALAPKAKPARDEADSSVDEKKRSRNQSDSKFNLLDLRRSAEARRESAAKVDSKADEPSSKETIREVKSSAQGHELVRELSLEPRRAGEGYSASRTERGPAAGGQDFQSMLAERMRDAWNGEIVKSAHIVLRDGDAGTIRIRLRPESLGNVKIELNLSDNNISGKILVDSDEAKTAFERNMNQLADAFRQGGFDSARLEVAVGGGSGEGASGKGSGDASGPFYSERLRSAVGSSADPATAGSAYARRGGAVDILA